MNKINNYVIIFIPDSLEKDNVGFLYGTVESKANETVFYITKDELQTDPTNCIGYYGIARYQSSSIKMNNWIQMSYEGKSVKVDRVESDKKKFKIICTYYNYTQFMKGEQHPGGGQHLYKLQNALNENNKQEKGYCRTVFCKILFIIISLMDSILKICRAVSPLSAVSHTAAHLEESIGRTREVLMRVKTNDGFLDAESVDAILSRIVDLVLGVAVAVWAGGYIAKWEAGAEQVVRWLRELLHFTMGSPVGLKLNHAFNSALGHFFLHHLELWHAFLKLCACSEMGSGWPLLLCVLGLSFQAALAVDAFRLVTFHVHCIYVYAARLYGAQLRALATLWRMLLGRKRNPMYGDRVDSLQCDRHQLFMATLFCALLLFLLPTTLMYYVVFATLRLLQLTVEMLLYQAARLPLVIPFYSLMVPRAPRLTATRNGFRIDLQCAAPRPAAATVASAYTTRSWSQVLAGLVVGDLL